jgi:protein-S-isoprenylcysteine O-methyltransferase Ste14
MSIIGKSSTRPVYFYSGKLLGYVSWVCLVLSMGKIIDIQMVSINLLDYIAYFLLAAGSAFTVISLINLGRSTRLGLPAESESTVFKHTGMYAISRNPMYVGFNLFTIAAILVTANLFILAMGLYSIAVYHMIIQGEERFLENRFGQAYLDYKKRVRKYL